MMGAMSEWERVDAQASVPQRPNEGAVATAAADRPAARMRRSRTPVIAAFDHGGRVFRRRLRDVSLASSAILVPAVALNLWVTVVLTDTFDPDRTVGPLFDDAASGSEDIGVFLAAIGVSLTTAVVGHLCAQMLLGDSFGRPVGALSAFATTMRKTPALLLVWSATHWWFVIGAALVATARSDTAIGLLFLASPVALVATSAVVLVVPAMVAEDLGPFASIRRGWNLARLRFGTCIGFVILATLLGTLFGIGISTLVPLVDQFGFLRFGDAAPTVVAVMAQFAVLFVVPLVALSTARFYVEMRLAAEGLDLLLDADAAFGPSPDPRR